MSIVRAFDRSMIKSFLDERDWRYLTDKEGDFRVDFGDDGTRGCELTVWFNAEGQNDQLLVVRVYSDKQIPRSDWGQVLMFCNTWTKEKRWPRAYLYASDPDSDARGQIVLDHHIDLSPGVHQELLDDWCITVLTTADDFWEKATRDLNLY